MLIIVKFVCVVKRALIPACSGRIIPVERGVCLDTKHVLHEGHGDLQGFKRVKIQT